MSDPAGDDWHSRPGTESEGPRTEGDGPPGRGLFDCPMADCDVVLIGDYDDLLDHLDREHPLSRTVVGGDGQSVRGRVVDARERVRREDDRTDATVGPERTAPDGGESSGTDSGEVDD